MAPLPANNTAVLFIEYTSLGQEHTAELRLPSTSGITEAQAVYADVAPTLAAMLPNTDSVTGARYRARLSNVSFPISVTPVTGTGGGAPDSDKRATFVSYTGRSADGRDVRFTVFTPFQDPDTNGFRIANPPGVTGDMLDVLLGLASQVRTISDGLIFWNNYVNYGFNAYYQRKLRRSG